jgi:hypothetical protein
MGKCVPRVHRQPLAKLSQTRGPDSLSIGTCLPSAHSLKVPRSTLRGTQRMDFTKNSVQTGWTASFHGGEVSLGAPVPGTGVDITSSPPPTPCRTLGRTLSLLDCFIPETWL